jgi:hypothetical protein
VDDNDSTEIALQDHLKEEEIAPSKDEVNMWQTRSMNCLKELCDWDQIYKNVEGLVIDNKGTVHYFPVLICPHFFFYSLLIILFSYRLTRCTYIPCMFIRAMTKCTIK